MADDSKRYPPSERRLSRLRQAGSTPASPALVGAAVIVVAGLMATLAWPAMVRWTAAWLHQALHAAGRPETALTTARSIALRGGLAMGAIGIVALAVALAVQGAQRGKHTGGGSWPPRGRDATGARWIDGWRGARAVLVTALALVAVCAAVRGVLMGVDRMAEWASPAETLATVVMPVAWPLLIVLVAVAVLDAIGGRAVWLRRARMTRREVEEEMRQAEGHPLTRERRSVASRRRRDA